MFPDHVSNVVLACSCRYNGAQQQDAELKAMKKRVELLRHERQELMELLLQKERQVHALDSVDVTSKEASALQLGVQAISMVHDASEMREKLQLAEAQIKTLKEERAAADELQQDTFEKLTDKRREAAELLELVSQRDMKVARVEAYLVTKEQCNAFKANVASRDEKILQLEAEVVRRDTMLELEAQLRKNDTERQVAYLAEVSKSRKLALDTRIQQDQCRAAMNDKQEKLAAAKHDLFRSQIAMERIRKAIGCAEMPETCYTRSEAIQSPANHSHEPMALSLPPNPVSDIPALPVEQSLHAMGADSLVRHSASSRAGSVPKTPPSTTMSPQAASNLTSPVAKPALSVAKPILSGTKPASAGSVPNRAGSVNKLPASPPTASLTGFVPKSEASYPPYSPVRGDPVDQAIAQLFERPEYRPLAAHVCRLGPGTYLCCMKEVTMELERDGHVVMRSPNGDKIVLASYLDLLRSGADGKSLGSALPLASASKVAIQSLSL